tara:strand:- start:781 stop:993 length:213 start_codon:yes stop_codon:yes gene_type:complete
MIRIEFANGTQTIKKICNMCGCHIDDLEVEDIMIKPANIGLTFKDKNGNDITRTELPDDLKVCKCENCND